MSKRDVMNLYDVLILHSGGKIFTYLIPEISEKNPVGRLVRVPLGASRVATGVVLRPGIKKKTCKYKSIRSMITSNFILDAQSIAMAEYISKQFLCGFGEALELFVPHYELTSEKMVDYIELGDMEQVLPSQKARRRVLEVLMMQGRMARLQLQKEANVNKNVIDQMVTSGALLMYKNRIHAQIKTAGDSVRSSFPAQHMNVLTVFQKKAVEQLKKVQKGSPYGALLHGVTGSGKTEIYFELMQQALSQGKRALFLLPEIALTPQMMRRVRARFPHHKIEMIHSKLNRLDRNHILETIAQGSCDILLGPRSALFAQMRALGVVIVDECHELSFRSETYPKYDAVMVARVLAEKSGAIFVMGSATPNVDDYYFYEQASKVVALSTRYNNYSVPKIKAIDMRIQPKRVISSSLHRALEDRLQRGEQSLLFVNKKGFSSISVCPKCGYVKMCPHCDVSMTHYRAQNRFYCSYCGCEQLFSNRCEVCETETIAFGIGTETLEAEIENMFPDARIARIDRSVVTSQQKLEQRIAAVEAHQVDILIGTQMIAKGLNFEKVTLVGILSADMQIKWPSYLASERAYQLFTQVSGRAGRTGLQSEVLLQTFHPDHYTITSESYQEFYQKELSFRKALQYPPFRGLLQLTFADKNEARARQSASRTADYLRARIDKKNLQNKVTIYDATAALLKRIDNKYRWQILISYDMSVEQSVFDDIIKVEDKLARTKLTRMNIDIGAKTYGT